MKRKLNGYSGDYFIFLCRIRKKEVTHPFTIVLGKQEKIHPMDNSDDCSGKWNEQIMTIKVFN